MGQPDRKGRASNTSQSDATEAANFQTVFSQEVVEIGKRKGVKLHYSVPSSNHGLVGLALSGGGIRSASFNLGILQSMIMVEGKVNVLRLFDYLSTVSGGGYIGSWLSAWVRRGGLSTVEQNLDPRRRRHSAVHQDREAKEIHHLRQFSNHFTPRLGLFSLDLWTAIAMYVRNLLLNQLIVLPLLMAVLLIPLIILGIPHPDISSSTFLYSLFVVVTAVFVGIVLLFSGLHRLDVWYGSNPLRGYRRFRAIGHITLAFVCAAILLIFIMALSRPHHVILQIYDYVLPWMPDQAFNIHGALLWATLGILLVGLAHISFVMAQKMRSRPLPRFWQSFLTFIVAGGIGGFLFYVILDVVIRHLTWADRPGHFITWGPPLGLLVFLITISLAIAWQVRYSTDLSREWLSSFGGQVFLYAICWGLLFSIAVYGPLLWQILADWTKTKITLVLGWIATTIVAILFGKSPSTGAADPTPWNERTTRVLAGLAMVGLFIALATVNYTLIVYVSPPLDDQYELDSAGSRCPTLCIVPVESQIDRSTVLDGEMEVRVIAQGREDGGQKSRAEKYWQTLQHASSQTSLLGLMLAICLGIVFVMAASVDVNEFSLHAFYRNRLVRGYLGASNNDPDRDPVSGFDPKDDIMLKHLLSDNGAEGPYHILNGALNLTASDELAWQERQASSFVFSPLYCGSKETGYMATKDFFRGQMTLGTALAISGAALSPNWGYHSSRPVAFFLALFNLRFGWWLGNPAHRVAATKTRGPSWGPIHMGFVYFFWELFGQTSHETPYVYVSDGGHFDNLGIYELVKRRCRYIVCCDASADPKYEYEDLGNTIRKIRIDLGIDIEIDIAMLRPKEGPYTQRHHTIGTIRYDMVEAGSLVGTLLYIKTSLTGSEPADVLEYAARNAAFPHEPTSDQYFGEQQMESYRRLGEHIGWEVLRYGQSSLF